MHKILILLLLLSCLSCRSKKKNDTKFSQKLEIDSSGKSFKGRLTDSSSKNQVLKTWRIEYEYVMNPLTGKPEQRKKSESGSEAETKETGKKQLDAESSEASVKKKEDKYFRITKTEFKTSPLNKWLIAGAFVAGFALCLFLVSKFKSNTQRIEVSGGYQPRANARSNPPGSGLTRPDIIRGSR